MADQTITLPPLQDNVEPTAQPGSSGSNVIVEEPMDTGMQPTGKEFAIAVGIVLVAAIIWFVVKNAYANWLMSSQKKSPNQGNAAGWSLFGTLLFPTIGAALGFVDGNRFLSLPYILPLGLATLVCLVLTGVISFKK